MLKQASAFFRSSIPHTIAQTMAQTAGLVVGATLFVMPAASAATVKVSIENLAPTNGNFLTPFWIGFHNGSFDVFNLGESANGFPGIEAIAEDGNTAPISERFDMEGAGSLQATLPGPSGPIGTGDIATMYFDLDDLLASGPYLSYASMIIPSNDAFVANDDPFEHRIFDTSGKFIGADFIILGSEVLDAGTEVNDELPANTAFFGQATPNTGVDENGVVQPHPGFIPGGAILSTPRFANATFTAAGYQVARVTVEKVPEPATVAGLLAIAGFLRIKRRR